MKKILIIKRLKEHKVFKMLNISYHGVSNCKHGSVLTAVREITEIGYLLLIVWLTQTLAILLLL